MTLEPTYFNQVLLLLVFLATLMWTCADKRGRAKAAALAAFVAFLSVALG